MDSDICGCGQQIDLVQRNNFKYKNFPIAWGWEMVQRISAQAMYTRALSLIPSIHGPGAPLGVSTELEVVLKAVRCNPKTDKREKAKGKKEGNEERKEVKCEGRREERIGK